VIFSPTKIVDVAFDLCRRCRNSGRLSTTKNATISPEITAVTSLWWLAMCHPRLTFASDRRNNLFALRMSRREQLTRRHTPMPFWNGFWRSCWSRRAARRGEGPFRAIR
jgi:hypothetical protein